MGMKKYRIVRTQTEYSFHEVVANSEQEAWDIYRESPEDFWVGAAYGDDIHEELKEN